MTESLRITHKNKNALSQFFCFVFLFASVGARVPVRSPTGDAKTCPSRTINYITQSLPQQCLKTSWSSPSTSYGVSSHTTTSTMTEAAQVPQSLHGTRQLLNTTRVLPINGATRSESSTATSPLTSIVAAATTTQYNSQTIVETNQDSEGDPLSDNANFLSFEEWKAQMLSKAGQNLETLGNNQIGRETRRRPGTINDALDSLGEDTEIELDFSGFVKTNEVASTLSTRKDAAQSESEHHGHEGMSTTTKRRSKDAGTTCKERFNYASFDCAATVLKTNPECKGSTSVLVENKDSYMLNECSAKNKFFIVELCNDILIDTLVLGNFEYFSSTFRTFRVSVSDRYPVKMEKWKELGTFEARNSRDLQAFVVENPLIWARYLRIEFLTHYGNEYYCPVSLLRIHGKTMMDDYRNEVKAARGEEDQDDDVPESENVVGNAPNAEKVAAGSTPAEMELAHASSVAITSDIPTLGTIASSVAIMATSEASGMQTVISQQNITISPEFTHNGPLLQQHDLLFLNCSSSKTFCNLISVERTPVADRMQVRNALRSSIIHSSTVKSTSLQSPTKSGKSHTQTVSAIASTTETVQSSSSSSLIGGNTPEEGVTSYLPSKAAVKTQTNQTSHSASRVAQQPPAASPTTQESFFRSIHKRLQLLEANSTLSLQYIEEQSRILREAFSKVEKRQLVKTTSFLEALNSTVLSELREFRLQYDQIWQSTVLELSAQREQSQREVIALSGRLSILADEMLFQKRMVILQFVLILLCLGLAIFSPRFTTAGAAYLELPTAVHNMVTRPSTSFSRYLHLDSPPATPSRPGSRYGFFSRTVDHIRSPSNQSNLDENSSKAVEAEYRPPTPLSDGSETEELRLSTTAGDASKDEVSIRRSASSPAISRDTASLH
ncbi:hypothetical protein MMC13_005600 [Lambiella insularis]|nr:hypothetical protein [Lambiella insularis]